jgi:polyhydroxyalkanoate synthesis repressor PhaR
MSASSNESVVIKKYANRRLYNTATSTYVTLENLAQMVKEGTEFNVYDAKSNEDITRSVLTQIIVEEEGKSGQTGQNLLPISFLRKLIGFYGDSMQWMVPKYLDQSMVSLTKNQEQIRDYFQTTFGKMFPFGDTLEQMSKQNMAVMEQAMRMFSPFNMGSFPLSAAKDDSACCGGEGPCADTKSTGSSSSSSPSAASSSKSSASSKSESESSSPAKASSKVTPMPMAETAKAAAAQSSMSGDDVQNKIAALQRQLSDLARKA